MPDYAVRTTFTARDHVSDSFDRMGRAASRFSNTASRSFDRAGRSSKQFGDRTSTAFRNSTKEGYKFMTIVKGILAANAIRGGIGAIGQGMSKTSTEFLNFEDTVIGAIARFDDLGPTAARNSELVAQFGRDVRQSIVGTRFAATQAAGSIDELAKAGYQSKVGLSMLREMMDFATAGGEDLVTATTMSSDILGSFGMRSSDTQKQIANHIRLNDMLTKSSLLSTGGLADLNETIQQTAPLASELNAAPSLLLAMATALSNSAIKGTEAATAIKRAYSNIYSGRMTAEFAANGINISDPKTGQLKQLPQILGEIGTALGKLPQDRRSEILFRIFGMYGLAGNLKLMRELGSIAEYQSKIENSQGVTKQVAAARNMSTFAKVVMLANAALEKGFQVLEAFNGDGQKGLEGLTQRINNFKVKPLVDGLRATGMVLKIVWTVMKPFLPALPWLALGWMAWNAQLKIFAGLKAAAVVWQIGAALTAGLGPVGAMTTALWAMVAPLSAMAVPLASLVAIGGLGAAGYSLFTGKDNFISKAAQGLGIVPKLQTNSEGVIASRDAAQAPNAQEAAARAGSWQGQLNIAGAPPGSTVTSKSTGAPGISVHMLGVNP